jgi:hypothetical protein
MANRRITKKKNRMLKQMAEKQNIKTEIKAEAPVKETAPVEKTVPVKETVAVAKPDEKASETKTRRKSMKARFFVQYQGHEFEEQEIVAAIKQKWRDDGNMVKDLKDIDIYAKPEEGKVYYTINGEVNGSIDVF